MSGPVLKGFSVKLHRRGGKTTGRIEVMATCAKHAERVAVEQVQQLGAVLQAQLIQRG